MHRPRFASVVACTAALLAPATAQDPPSADAPSPKPHALIGRPAPAWRVSDWVQLPRGVESPSVEDYRGKVVYLYCFQSWCPGCHSSGFPTLQALKAHYADEPDVVFVAVQTVFEGLRTNTAERARATAKRYGLTDIPFGHDVGADGKRSDLMRDYRTRGTPWTIVIDRAGVVQFADFHLRQAAGIELVDRLVAQRGLGHATVGRPFGDPAKLEWIRGEPRGDGARWTLYRWWTDGCPFCRDSLPDLARLQREHANRGLRVVAVHHQKGRRTLTDDELLAYCSELGFDGAVAKDANWQRLKELRADRRSPTSMSFLVDDRGIVRWVHRGPRLHRATGERHADADRAMRELEALLVQRSVGASK